MESKMEAKQQQLTSREEAYFEHVGQAKAQGLSLKEYCEKLGLNVRGLYSVRRVLVQKGVLPRTLPPREPKTKKVGSGKFVAVRVAETGTNGAQVCRVHHRSGWSIECGRLPEAAWVAALIKGAEDASA
jgi:hypothetical protein